jgi:Glycosyl transferase family 2
VSPGSGPSGPGPRSRPLATVVVPTHDHDATLDLAVASALGQTVEDVEVIIVGDGVTESVRDRARQLEADDDRVRFLDLPKGPHHGEPHRDLAVRQARSEAICYLCDDDLLLPEHLADMIELLADADLVQCMNGSIGPDGTFSPDLGDLSSAEFRRWLLHPHRNSISLTGTVHTRSAYLRLGVGWEVPPPGRWPDHFMWQKFVRHPGFRGATSTRVTVLQFPSHLAGREQWTQSERRAELLRWTVLLDDADARRRFQAEAGAVVRREAADWRARRDELIDHADRLQAHVERAVQEAADAETRRSASAAALDSAQLQVVALEHEISALRDQVTTLQGDVAELRHQLGLVLRSRTWRAREWLTAHHLRPPIRRGRAVSGRTFSSSADETDRGPSRRAVGGVGGFQGEDLHGLVEPLQQPVAGGHEPEGR